MGKGGGAFAPKGGGASKGKGKKGGKGGGWVTMNGSHVLIGANGAPTKGNKSLLSSLDKTSKNFQGVSRPTPTTSKAVSSASKEKAVKSFIDKTTAKISTTPKSTTPKSTKSSLGEPTLKGKDYKLNFPKESALPPAPKTIAGKTAPMMFVNNKGEVNTKHYEKGSKKGWITEVTTVPTKSGLSYEHRVTRNSKGKIVSSWTYDPFN